ncbi:MAG: tetratricopeptide repeat protein [Gemmataceae bacterium]
MRTLSFLILLLSAGLAQAQSANDLLKDAMQKLFKERQPDEAMVLVEKAIKADPKNPRAYLVRGFVFENKEMREKSIADFTKVIELAPKSPEAAEAYQRRGGERFKQGDIKGSIEDFDAYIARNPQAEAGHWQRGISYYYAKEFDKGAKQFNAYEKVDTNDVENAVWHFLCNARAKGVDKARGEILKIGKDGRVPMMTVYALFKGEAKPEDVLKDAQAGSPPKDRLNRQLFYAHLYLGLYYEALGDKKKAAEHIARSVEHKVDHYMWDVARVHRDLLKKN